MSYGNNIIHRYMVQHPLKHCSSELAYKPLMVSLRPFHSHLSFSSLLPPHLFSLQQNVVLVPTTRSGMLTTQRPTFPRLYHFSLYLIMNMSS